MMSVPNSMAARIDHCAVHAARSGRLLEVRRALLARGRAESTGSHMPQLTIGALLEAITRAAAARMN